MMVNLPAFGQLDLAGLAVVVTVFAVDCWIHRWEDEAIYLIHRVRRVSRDEESFSLL